MTNAPIPRETADHAELLARLANDMRKFEHHAVGSLRIDMDEVRKVIAACDSHAALLSEIAALREERRNIVSHATMGTTDGEGMSLNDVSVAITCVRNVLHTRATQAERQRDEAVGLLRRYRSDLPTEALEDLTDAFLANQGAE